MKQKTALLIALGLTTFILVAVGAVVLAWPAVQSPQSADLQAANPDAVPALDANADPQTLLATAQAREAAYRTQIKQANSQLEQAYQQLSQLQAQNQILQQREQIYQQRLQESAQLIEAMSAGQTSQSNIVFSGEQEEHEEFEDHD